MTVQAISRLNNGWSDCLKGGHTMRTTFECKFAPGLCYKHNPFPADKYRLVPVL